MYMHYRHIWRVCTPVVNFIHNGLRNTTRMFYVTTFRVTFAVYCTRLTHVNQLTIRTSVTIGLSWCLLRYKLCYIRKGVYMAVMECNYNHVLQLSWECWPLLHVAGSSFMLCTGSASRTVYGWSLHGVPFRRCHVYNITTQIPNHKNNYNSMLYV